MLWVDPTDPSVVAAVLGEASTDPAELDSVHEVIAVASETLSTATANKIHPAGTAIEEFTATRRFKRFSPLYGPVSAVTAIEFWDEQKAAWVETPRQWRLVGGTIHFLDTYFGFFPFGWDYGVGVGAYSFIGSRPLADVVPQPVQFRVIYDYASTVTPGARRAVLMFARELWLSIYDTDTCSLPERVTSVTREGLSMQLLTPADYMDKGRTGLPRVDTWLASVNPSRSHRASAVYTPDSPPGVPVSARRRGW